MCGTSECSTNELLRRSNKRGEQDLLFRGVELRTYMQRKRIAYIVPCDIFVHLNFYIRVSSLATVLLRILDCVMLANTSTSIALVDYYVAVVSC